jgi:hypothetical protein
MTVILHRSLCGLGSQTEYSDSQQSGWSGDRILVGATFSTPIQIGPRAHPAFYTMSTGSFLGVLRLGSGDNLSPHLTPRLKKNRAIPLLLPLCVHGMLQSELPLLCITVLCKQ